jgi:uncharacterized membrane protein YfcA
MGQAMTTRTGILLALAVLNVAFIAAWIRAAKNQPGDKRPSLAAALIGAVTAFFDTLGIGSFAPTTALFKLRGTPSDELIPGTLNIGLNMAGCLETAIFISAVAVEPALLGCMIASAACGAWLGAGVVSRLPRRTIQLCMGVALLIAGSVFVAANVGALPTGGMAMGLAGWKFGFAVGANFVLGALLSVGIGNYAPCMIMLALLGLNPLAAFPIMMGSCGLVQPLAGLRFFKSGRFAWRAALGLTCGSAVGVLLAAFVVKSLPLVALRWLVVVVVLYAAASMLQSAWRSRVAAVA